jgi:hypothetical protein
LHVGGVFVHGRAKTRARPKSVMILAIINMNNKLALFKKKLKKILPMAGSDRQRRKHLL